MRYFSPNLAPGWLDGGAPTGPTDHFGGWPWGLPLERWPACRECGGALTFIAQFEHDPLRLDLGAEGRVLFLFWCLRDPYICAVWEPDGGANAAIVLDREECTVSASSADAPMEPYVTILSWSEHDDGVSAAEYRDFLDGEASPFDNDAWHVDFDARLGGTPYWSNGPPMHEMDDSWRFTAQLTEGVYLNPPVPTPDQLGCKVVFQHQPSERGNTEFISHSPSVTKPFAPESVTVFDDGTWHVGSGSGTATILVFVRVVGAKAEGRIFLLR